MKLIPYYTTDIVYKIVQAFEKMQIIQYIENQIFLVIFIFSD